MRVVGYAVVDRDNEMRGWAKDRPLALQQADGKNKAAAVGSPFTARPLRYADDDVNTDEGGE